MTPENSSCRLILWRLRSTLFLIAVAASTGCREPVVRIQPIEANITRYDVGENGELVPLAEWVYGAPVKVPGESGFIVPLQSVWRGSTREYLLDANFLFVDSDLKVMRWLLPDNKQSIHWERVGDEKARAMLCEVREQSMDGEREPKLKSPLSLYLCRPDCTSPTKVLSDVTRVIGKQVTDDGHLLVFYVKDDTGHAAKMRLADFSVVGTVALKIQE